MTQDSQSSLNIRPLHYRDLEAIEALIQSESGFETESYSRVISARRQLTLVRQWYGPLKCLSLFPNPLQHAFSGYVAGGLQGLEGFIQVSPFNRTSTTWRVERIIAADPLRSVLPKRSLMKRAQLPPAESSRTEIVPVKRLPTDTASVLLRHCLETIWRARIWLVEVGVNDKLGIGLYRTNGFQPLAQKTYWSLSASLLETLSERPVDLPNLRPVSNADASLLYQLDTVSMPPLVRQAFDRHISDFRTGLARGAVASVKRLMAQQETVKGYVFEPQRKAAIGYFNLCISKTGHQPHSAQLTVHPAYTYLYPELLSQMAQLVQGYPKQSLELASSDYQPERETYLKQTGATPEQETVMMFRSVWHKMRESKSVSLENLQLVEVLQGLQPSRKPVPGRISLFDAASSSPNGSPADASSAEPARLADADEPTADGRASGSRRNGDRNSGSADQGGAWSPH
ncbi:MAG: GNAT family N-acetyltransferase [Elainellaceae cyanobacterium]